MILNIGSTNPVKVEAVKEVIKLYEIFYNAEICSLEVASGVSKQPISINEIIDGATNRSIKSFKNCDYSFGIESGLMYVSPKYFDITACVFFDGEDFSTGFSCAFEIPKKILNIVLDEKLTLGESAYIKGLTSNNELGKQEGLIGLLTKGRIDRKEYTEQAVMMALIRLENRILY